jgi:hypothetical protein
MGLEAVLEQQEFRVKLVYKELQEFSGHLVELESKGKQDFKVLQESLEHPEEQVFKEFRE